MIYFIRVKGTSFFKIGRAVDARKRLSSIASDNHLPVELCLTLKMRIYHDANLEADIHAYFSKSRLRGEWFNLTVGDVESYLQQHKPNRFTDWNQQQQVYIHCSIQNYIPEEISFPSQEANV